MLDMFNRIVWLIATSILLYNGCYLSKQTGYIQFKFIKMFKEIFKNSHDNFKTFGFALATKIGVGSIVGIAICLYYGGKGSIFWLFISTFVIVPNAFFESVLGSLFKRKKGNLFVGGPHYYLSCFNNKLSKLYAFFVFLAYCFGFMAIQVNTISNCFTNLFSYSGVFVGLFLVVLISFFIFKGSNLIIKTCSLLVSFMSVLYILCGIYVCICHFSELKDLLCSIVCDAFNFKSFGFGILSSAIIGIQRGVFSSECGIGGCAISSAISNTNNHIKQGYLQVMGVYFTNFIICMMTVLILLTSGVSIDSSGGGLNYVLMAFHSHFGEIGVYVLFICICLFAFSTVLAGYYICENSICFLFKKVNLFFLRIVIILVLFVCSILNAKFIWNLADILIGIITIINIYAIYKLRGFVFNLMDK